MACDIVNPDHANLYLQALAVVATLVLNEEDLLPDMHVKSDPIWINTVAVLFLSIAHYSLYMCILIGMFTMFFNVIKPCTSIVNVMYPSYYFLLAMVSHFIGSTFWSITFNGGFISDSIHVNGMHTPPSDVRWLYFVISQSVKFILIFSVLICMYILHHAKSSKRSTLSAGSTSL